MWLCIDARLWTRNFDAHLEPTDICRICLLHLKNEMWEFYAAKRNGPDGEQWQKRTSMIFNLSLKMLGKRDRPMLGAKASETHGLVEFATNLLIRHQAELCAQGGALHSVG